MVEFKFYCKSCNYGANDKGFMKCHRTTTKHIENIAQIVKNSQEDAQRRPPSPPLACPKKATRR